MRLKLVIHLPLGRATAPLEEHPDSAFDQVADVHIKWKTP